MEGEKSEVTSKTTSRGGEQVLDQEHKPFPSFLADDLLRINKYLGGIPKKQFEWQGLTK